VEKKKGFEGGEEGEKHETEPRARTTSRPTDRQDNGRWIARGTPANRVHKNRNRR
jgi:hypothetical protein